MILIFLFLFFKRESYYYLISSDFTLTRVIMKRLKKKELSSAIPSIKVTASALTEIFS